MKFSQADIAQIEAHGLGMAQVEAQIESFRRGFDYLPIASAATAGNGIVTLSNTDINRLIKCFDKNNISIVKFVPASGAATRMFKELFEYVNEDKRSESVDRLLAEITKTPFYDRLSAIVGGEAAERSDPKRLAGAIVGSDGLDYGALPKGLIPFHRYPDGSSRTAAEEHLVEGAMYATSNGVASIHFTVSPEHRDGFRRLFTRVKRRYEQTFGVRFRIAYSFQQSATDTIAVNPDNTPFRNSDDTLLFRPAGHGALLANLNAIRADLIFIKTVDNVAPDHLKADTVRYKKVLGALALELQGESFALLRGLDAGEGETVSRAVKFIENRLSYRLRPDFQALTARQQAREVRRILNRPLRVCGMVRNEGEPGGGPFLVTEADGSQSLQIAESSQIAPDQMYLMRQATHFNPVDLVCAVRDYRGRKFDLRRFTDPATGFISTKSKEGRPLKAQELPGLWNGAMARWNTVFVEAPISTFSPVKVVTDLLRKQHQ